MTYDVAESLQYRKAEIAAWHIVCPLSKYYMQNSAKFIFAFSALMRGVIFITNGLLLPFLSQSEISLVAVYEKYLLSFLLQ